MVHHGSFDRLRLSQGTRPCDLTASLAVLFHASERTPGEALDQEASLELCRARGAQSGRRSPGWGTGKGLRMRSCPVRDGEMVGMEV